MSSVRDGVNSRLSRRATIRLVSRTLSLLNRRTSRPTRRGCKRAWIKPIAGAATTWNASVTDTTDPDEWFAASQPFVGAFQPVKIVIAYDDARYTQTFEEIVPIIAGS